MSVGQGLLLSEYIGIFLSALSRNVYIIKYLINVTAILIKKNSYNLIRSYLDNLQGTSLV